VSVTKTAAIKAFLMAQTHEDLALMYHHDMECQVNVAQDGGERIEGEYQGRQWHGFTDGIETWKSFRIPYNANSEPSYNDTQMSFDLMKHADGIGMTGWNWVSRKSMWVAFDYDAITGHSAQHTNKLSIEELERVRIAASEIPWVTVRRSTSGKGLHLYVKLDGVDTTNHTEHAALARSILGMMSANTGFDFKSKVDICGGNMWVWHRKMKGTDGLTLIKTGEVLQDIPVNWRDHLVVVSGKKRRTVPGFVESEEVFDEVAGQRQRIPLDEDHKKLVKFLEDTSAMFWWDQDHHMLVAHTYDLKQAHQQLNFKGIFDTVSSGKEQGQDHNCFLFPLRRGAWSVRRYSRGIQEAPSWSQDGTGYTRCYLNREPDFDISCRSYSGLEHPSGGYVLPDIEAAKRAVESMGASLSLPNYFGNREVTLKKNKEGKLVVEMEYDNRDKKDEMSDWLNQKNKKWVKVINATMDRNSEVDVDNFDDIVRHIISRDGIDLGWVIKSDVGWVEEPLSHVTNALAYQGLKVNESKNVVGSSVFKPWTVVNLPFQPEYPGDRQWNRNAAQLKYAPAFDKDELSYPTWQKILNHIGVSLDVAVQQDNWCKINNLKTGADYLKCWIASLFQFPDAPLPYLFLYGPQGSGKSIFHRSISMLLTSGYKRADAALANNSGFNAELEDAILAAIEETDLQKNKNAYNKIKDWVTSDMILIHKKMVTPYMAKNTSHWVQCSNERSACPTFPGDTRVTFIYVDTLKEQIPQRQMDILLSKEAPDFLAEVLRLELPEPNDRLNIPVLDTDDKKQAMSANETLLETFIKEECFEIPGVQITKRKFYEAFIAWLEPNDRFDWTVQKISKTLPDRFPQGRNAVSSEHSYGNLSLIQQDPKEPLVAVNGKLMKKSQVDYITGA
jgi:hypothetical protein